MTEKKYSSPAEASREGLRQLKKSQPKHHGTTGHTPAPHPSGSKFDETASEEHRGGPLPDQGK